MDYYMGTPALIKYLLIPQQLDAGLSSIGAWPNATLSFMSLSFNPIKLVCLVGWVYLCLYFVQRVQFSSLVPKNRKSIANIATLFLGPILLFVLLIVDVVKKSYEGHRSVFEILKGRLQNASASMRSLRLGSKDKTALRLLDSSGRSITEIYGHGKGKREDSHVLELTEQIIADALKE
ncbi:MAG: hypothetical protein WAK60_07650, partial [Sedimentisphaerales bacterium]